MGVLETSRFRLADGVDEAEFLAADRRVQEEFAPFQPGFARRTTAKGEDGEWLVVWLWGSDEDADRSQALTAATDVVADFVRLIDPSSLRTSRWHDLDHLAWLATQD